MWNTKTIGRVVSGAAHYSLIPRDSLSYLIFYFEHARPLLMVVKRLSDNSHHLGRSADGVATLAWKRNHPFKSSDTLFLSSVFKLQGRQTYLQDGLKKKMKHANPWYRAHRSLNEKTLWWFYQVNTIRPGEGVKCYSKIVIDLSLYKYK